MGQVRSEILRCFGKRFLEGFHGFTASATYAFQTFLNLAKVYELERGIVERPSNVRREYRPQGPGDGA